MHDTLQTYIDTCISHNIFAPHELTLLDNSKNTLAINPSDKDSNLIYIQAIQKGQIHGLFSLDDASFLFKTCIQLHNKINDNDNNNNHVVNNNNDFDDDLSSLSEPVPLKLIS